MAQRDTFLIGNAEFGEDGLYDIVVPTLNRPMCFFFRNKDLMNLFSGPYW